ncbi:MAG: aldolase/citrate lyase family protein, partial [Clostridia bacterium]|nr:aldolase/citrate lyase family protein [Clostridia bacterium]
YYPLTEDTIKTKECCIMERLMKRIEKGEVVRGVHIFIGDMQVTECIAGAGYDVMWIDTEHTAIGKEMVLQNLIASKAGGTPAFVRIAKSDHTLAKPILDMGVDGIIFPYVRNAAEAKEAVSFCDYPMSGERGYGPMRAIDYGKKDAYEYVMKDHRKTWRMIQIEHIDAVNDLENIVRVDGIDAFIVGPNDLAASMGHLGDIFHPDVVAACDEIARVMKKYNKIFGVSTLTNEAIIKTWVKRGANIIFTGTDIGFVYGGAKENLELLNNLIVS